MCMTKTYINMDSHPYRVVYNKTYTIMESHLYRVVYDKNVYYYGYITYLGYGDRHPWGQAASAACSHEGGGPIHDLPGPD